MKLVKINPPRCFEVGRNGICLSHVADIELNSDELVTFKNGDLEYDVCKKDWGFYATPSINKRLLSKGYETYIVENSTKQLFCMLVDKRKKQEFKNYLELTKQSVVKAMSVD